MAKVTVKVKEIEAVRKDSTELNVTLRVLAAQMQDTVTKIEETHAVPVEVDEVNA